MIEAISASRNPSIVNSRKLRVGMRRITQRAAPPSHQLLARRIVLRRAAVPVRNQILIRDALVGMVELPHLFEVHIGHRMHLLLIQRTECAAEFNWFPSLSIAERDSL